MAIVQPLGTTTGWLPEDEGAGIPLLLKVPEGDGPTLNAPGKYEKVGKVRALNSPLH